MILKGIEGVYKVKTDPETHSATVTYDPKRTNVEDMKKALAAGEYPVEGDPRFLD
ncbi:MAG: heavy-metal-associated domain-containing protein [Deltaproteobacteria bacterium]|nr:heavy-metal-associated domain-containing protein [Deltaproteobacteria bacterium]